MTALTGKRIVITRPGEQAAELGERLRAQGAIPLHVPTIAVMPAASSESLDRALQSLDGWDWVIFTSANGVRFVFARAAEIGIPQSTWQSVRVAAIGPATASALLERGITLAAVPEEYLADRIADVVGEIRGVRFLLLRANIAGNALPRRLRAAGGLVDDVVAYHTTEHTPDADALEALSHGVDAITFTSPSTVHGFAHAVRDWPLVTNAATIATIGPVTSAAARELGMRVDIEAVEHSADGLLDALVRHFGQTGG